MAIDVAKKVETTIALEVAPKNGDLVQFQAPRLPYHEAIKERFGIDRAGWKTLIEAIYPGARTIDAVVLALSYCQARNLDVFKRPVHIVPVWDSKKGGYVETIWPGIAELRTTAFRTGQYAGCDEAEFGPNIEATFTGRVKSGDAWIDKTVNVEFPQWCRVTVYRDVGGRLAKFVGPRVYWLESYGAIGASDLPNEMWTNRASGQLEKCAEAGAIRRAFPEEAGNMPTAEEMEGNCLIEIGDAAAKRPPSPDAQKPTAPKAAAKTEASAPKPEASAAPRKPPSPGNGEPNDDLAIMDRRRPATPQPEDRDAYLKFVGERFASAGDLDTLTEAWDRHVDAVRERILPNDITELGEMFGRRQRKIDGE